MVPTVELPPVTPLTLHVTAAFEVLVTVAVNCCTPAAGTWAVGGETVTTTVSTKTVKLLELTAVPVLVVTLMGPEVAPPGTTAVTEVEVELLTLAAVPPKVTWFPEISGLNPLPEMITVLPTGPLVGAKLVMFGGLTVIVAPGDRLIIVVECG